MSMFDKNISISRFKNIFLRLGWKESNSKSGRYQIWTHPENNEIWTLIPHDENSLEYKYYQEKNIRMIIYALGLEETEWNINEIYTQLTNFNYKLINRIVNRVEFSNDSIPYELAVNLPNKNIEALRSFFLLKTRGKKSLPIDNFELSHTQKGSFVIPISIYTEVKENTLFNMPNDTNILLREYLDTIDKLVKINVDNEIKFADKVIESGIDSKIVKDFLNKNDGIAKFKNKYKEKVKEITISSNSNPILDYGLSENERSFKTVHLDNIEVLPDEYISTLERREIEADSATIEAYDVKIEAVVSEISQNKKAKFDVFAVDGKEIKKSFKAISVELPKVNLDFCVDVFKEKNVIEITGDILKPRGKSGKIVATKFEIKPKDPNLFTEE